MLSIGELSKRSGASVRSLRHYEHSGLLAAARLSNGYRYFKPEAVEYVQRIRVLLGNGFTLDEIRPIASMLDPQPRSMRDICTDVIAMYGSKLVELDQRIADLKQIRDSAAARLRVIEVQRRQGGPVEPGMPR